LFATTKSRFSMQITALVAVALFIENLDSNVIVTALTQLARSSAAPVQSARTSGNGLHAHFSRRHSDRPLDGGSLRCRAGVYSRDRDIHRRFGAVRQEQWSFTACRVLQGAGGAMTPVGRLVMLRATHKRDLARLISYVALSGLAAPVLGPPVGGAITTYLGWRWIFFLNLPLGLIGVW
jgi:MFS family permease